MKTTTKKRLRRHLKYLLLRVLPLCHEDESSSLLQFKHIFLMNKSASGDPSAYSKVESWKKFEGKSSDCCSWDGVKCDHDTGHVIGLDLSSSFLYGSINSNSSLFNLVHLQRLNLAYNHFNYSQIPPKIGHLPRFHGAIENPETNLKFPNLRIIDLSHNGFSGNLPSDYFQNWRAMKTVMTKKLTYISWIFSSNQSLKHVILTKPVIPITYMYSMVITSKGTQILYEKIQDAVVVVDLSNNKFEGQIPEALGSLCGLKVLSISNNSLIGKIPSSLANLTELESLDLSINLLSGEIPPQLSQLTFLEFLNVSHNHLTGPIPQGKQFDTFENNSYIGNFGLCGKPLSKLCGNSEASPPPSLSFHGDDSKFPSGVVDWIIILLGYGSGLIVGLVIGHTLTTRYHEWFVEKFGTRKQTQRRVQRKRRRN